MDYYQLIDGKVVKADEWIGTERVGRTKTEKGDVSTVFLCIDHGFGNWGKDPVLFETMVFGGLLDGYQERYCTLEEAEQGHEVMCYRVEKGILQ